MPGPYAGLCCIAVNAKCEENSKPDLPFKCNAGFSKTKELRGIFLDKIHRISPQTIATYMFFLRLDSLTIRFGEITLV